MDTTRASPARRIRLKETADLRARKAGRGDATSQVAEGLVAAERRRDFNALCRRRRIHPDRRGCARKHRLKFSRQSRGAVAISQRGGVTLGEVDAPVLLA